MHDLQCTSVILLSVFLAEFKATENECCVPDKTGNVSVSFRIKLIVCVYMGVNVYVELLAVVFVTFHRKLILSRNGGMSRCVGMCLIMMALLRLIFLLVKSGFQILAYIMSKYRLS